MLKDKNRALKKELSVLQQGENSSRLESQKARNAALKERTSTLKDENSALKEELGVLRKSYHLSGAGKKIDLRDIDGFADVARMIMAEGRSGMNFDRLYVLWQAVRGTRSDLPLVEVGAYKGGSARFIGETLRRDGRERRLYVCDTFAGHPRTDPVIDNHHSPGNFGDTSADEVEAYLDDPHAQLVVGDIMETTERIADESFSFVHLDLDLYEATDHCLRFFAPRLAPDAVIVLDDFGVITCPGVQRAADEFLAETPEYRLFHLLSGQAIVFKAV